MKVLFLARYLNASGVTTHMLTLGKGMIEKGHEVKIITGGIPKSNEKQVTSLINNSKVKVEFNGFPKERGNKFIELFRYLTTIPKTLIMIRKFKPDLIHVHWPVTSYIADIYRKIFKVPVIQTFHTDRNPKSILHKKADKVIAISSELEFEMLNKFDYKMYEVTKIFNGVDESNFQKNQELQKETKKNLGILSNEIIISYVGAITPQKGIDILCKAIKELNNKNIKLIITGSGDHKWLKNIVNDINLQNQVIILPFQDPYNIYNISDIFVLPSLKEGFSLVVIEAMLMGVPVIRSNTGGCYDQIEPGVTGYIYNKGAVTELINCLSELVENRDVRERIGALGKARAQQLFSSKVMVEQTLNLYKDVLKNKKDEGI